MQIWKYKLAPVKTCLTMPKGAQVLSAHVQHGRIHLWALLDPKGDRELRDFSVWGTGQDVPLARRDFIATVHLPEHGLVWHVFEDLE